MTSLEISKIAKHMKFPLDYLIINQGDPKSLNLQCTDGGGYCFPQDQRFTAENVAHFIDDIIQKAKIKDQTICTDSLRRYSGCCTSGSTIVHDQAFTMIILGGSNGKCMSFSRPPRVYSSDSLTWFRMNGSKSIQPVNNPQN